MRFFSLLVLCGLLAVWGTAADDKAQTKLNEAVLKFAKSKFGEKVDRGECTDLANQALKAAGAVQHQKFKDFPNPGDYVWGEEVAYLDSAGGQLKLKGNLKKVKPGDIMQFRDSKFAGRNLNGKGTYTKTMPHHTAVVSDLANDGRLIKVLHQNVTKDKTVVEWTLNLDDLKEGWLRIYHPIAK